MARRQNEEAQAGTDGGFEAGDPKRLVHIRNLDPMLLKLRLDPETANRARADEVIGICHDADVWILGAHGGKKHREDVPEEIAIPGYVFDAVNSWDPPAEDSPAEGNAYQRKLIEGYERTGQITIRGA
jgi:hypothetical protein